MHAHKHTRTRNQARAQKEAEEAAAKARAIRGTQCRWAPAAGAGRSPLCRWRRTHRPFAYTPSVLPLCVVPAGGGVAEEEGEEEGAQDADARGRRRLPRDRGGVGGRGMLRRGPSLSSLPRPVLPPTLCRITLRRIPPSCPARGQPSIYIYKARSQKRRRENRLHLRRNASHSFHARLRLLPQLVAWRVRRDI